jgi:hypothetical protein
MQGGRHAGEVGAVSRPDLTHSSGERRLRPLDMLASEHPFPWRVGGNVPFHIYDATPAQGGEVGPAGRYIATARTAELAALIVGSVNDTARRAGLL